MIAFHSLGCRDKGPQCLICLRSIVAWDTTITSPFGAGNMTSFGGHQSDESDSVTTKMLKGSQLG